MLDLHDHDSKLDSLKVSVAFKFMIILQDLIGTNHEESGKIILMTCDCKLPELDVVTMQIGYFVNM